MNMSTTPSTSQTFILHSQPIQGLQGPDAEYPFDPESQLVIDTLPARHKTHVKASEAITQAAHRTASSIENGRTALRNGLTYDEFLAGLLYSEETMLVSQFISFDSVTFDAEKESPPLSSMTAGRAFLTNRRLLLLSAEAHQGLSLTKIDDGQGKKPSGYIITGKASDTLHFQSIPITNIHSVELNASVGVLSVEAVVGVKPCCCLALCGCFGMDRCIKKWISAYQSSALATSQTNERILTMGVTMPPWDNRYMTKVHFNIEAPLVLVKEYIVALTRFAPNVAAKARGSALVG